jgi:lipoprotein-releasing system ATP-binding protein
MVEKGAKTGSGSRDGSVIRLVKVVKDYGETVKTRALDGVDLLVGAGEFTALIGPSGSGKSTLLNIIGLLDQPTSGHVSIGGIDTTERTEGEITRLRGSEIGFVFQFHHLLPAFSALENVMLPAYASRGRRDATIAQRARELLVRVGLENRIDYRSNDLSGGQQQRVAIARSLIARPPLILADEPTGNLDTKSADEVFELLREINSEDGTAFLIVTHDPRMADRCDRIVELVDGRIVSDRKKG